MHKNLNAKERHFILPLVCGPLLCSPSLLLLPQQDRIKLIFSALISHTYLERIFYCLQHDNLLEGSYSIHRQVWWTLMAKLGLGILEAQVVSLLAARNLASMRGNGKLNMFGRSMTIYFN